MSARRTDGGLMVKMELVKDSTVRLNNCEYSLVWTARPVQSEKKNHQLLPVNLPIELVPLKARNSLKIFTNDARSLFSKHNRGIKEYTFIKKSNRILWRFKDNIYLCTALEKRRHGGCSSVG